MARLAEWKHAILLVLLVGGALLQPLTPDRGGIVPVLEDLLVTFAMVFVFFAVFGSRASRVVALGAALVSVAAKFSRYFLPEDGGVLLGVVHDATLAFFYGFAVVEVLRRIFQKRNVGADDILGSVCGFLLAGAAWASLYSLVDRLVPGSFAVSAAYAADLAGWHTRHALFDSLSFVTLTTMGYVDVTPVRAPAITLGWLEAVFGLFYMAVVVAQLVAAHLTKPVAPGTPDSP